MTDIASITSPRAALVAWLEQGNDLRTSWNPDLAVEREARLAALRVVLNLADTGNLAEFDEIVANAVVDDGNPYSRTFAATLIAATTALVGQ